MEFLLPRLWTFLTAMTPVGELRAAIPLGLGTFGLGIIETYIIAVVGNMVPVVAILWILEPISRFLMKKFNWANRFFTWLFDRTRKRHSKSLKNTRALHL